MPLDCHLPAGFAAHYGLDRLYNHYHANGAGQSLAIVTLQPLDSGAAPYFWANIAHIQKTGRSLSVVNVDGGPGPNPGGGPSVETDLDVEQSGAIAPGANVIVYQAPNTDYGLSDALFKAASQNLASSVSMSWGQSETLLRYAILNSQESAGYQTAVDEAFLEMAAQGQSGFLASGDTGAYGALLTVFGQEPYTNLDVLAEEASPYVTSAGGTTLPWSGSLPSAAGTIKVFVSVSSERAWGWDYLWKALEITDGFPTEADAAETFVSGDGGGHSSVEPMPSYQQGVPGTGDFHAVEYLTPTAYVTLPGGQRLPTRWTFTAAPHVTSGTATGRAVPDLSADADPATGYLVYAGNGLQGGWGGTSFVAPQLNGAAAVINSYLHHRVGLWNPAIYKFAVGASSPFTSLNTASTSNDNLYYTGNPGKIYSPAVGLGIPNLTLLAQDFARSGY